MERQVAIWAHAAPWSERTEQATEGRPRWANANAALLAYAAWLVNEGGYSSSALGGLLDRLKRGQTFTARGPVTDARDVRAVDDMDTVRRALEVAYPDGGDGVQFLLLRTPGVAEIWHGKPGQPTPTFESLALTCGHTARQVQNLVVRGRETVTAELVRRGVIPVPRERVRSERGDPCPMARS